MMEGQLCFRYRDGAGKEDIHTLVNWKEIGRYIQGVRVEAGQFRTYLKYRVLEYKGGSAALLTDPSPRPPLPVVKKPGHGGPEIIFTGFETQRRQVLETMAIEHGLRVVASVTKGLAMLVGGYNVGPAKLEKARGQNVVVLDEAAYLKLLETGEIPDPS